jgi:hypothetical protein
VTRLTRLTLAGVLLAAAVPARAGEVKVSFSNGLVTIVATDASPRQILGEWARLGQVRITNLDRLAGGPVTLQLTDVTEAQALETLLRGTAGYVAAPRAEVVAANSRYDRILLLPGVAPALSIITATAPSAVNPGVGRGRPSGPPMFDAAADDESELARPTPGMTQPWIGRDATRPGQNWQPMPGPVTMPGMPVQPQVGYPGIPTSQSPGAVQQVPATEPGFDRANMSQRQQSSSGSSVPGVSTAPSTLQTTPNSNAGPPGLPTQTNMPSSVPGQLVTQPGQTTDTPVSAPRPGELVGSPSVVYQNSLKPPTPAPTTPPTVPIKKSPGNGGEK